MSVLSRVLVVVLVIATVATLGPVSAASADPGENRGVGLGQLTAADRQAAARKIGEMQAWLAQQRRPPAPARPHGATIASLAYGCSDCAIAAGSLYMEPQASYAFNWCGAGTAAALVSGWGYRIQGYDMIPGWSRLSRPDGTYYRWFYGAEAFEQHLAYDNDLLTYRYGGGIAEPSGDVANEWTTDTDLARVANLYVGYAFYVVNRTVGTVGTFQGMLRFDIGNYRVPLSAVVLPCPPGRPCLPGWSGASSGMAHWQTAGAYAIANDQITYGDSASKRQAYFGQDPYGWHDRSLQEYFNVYMKSFNGYGLVVW